jgi:hypothetical protein
VGDLGSTNSQAIERLKEKLEARTMANYRKVLEDIKSQLIQIDGGTPSIEHG